MILLWTLWMIAVLCKTSQGDDIISTTLAEGTNLTTAPPFSLISTTTDTLKAIRDKRGTGQLLEQLLKENDLTEDVEDEDEEEIGEDIINDKIKRGSRGNVIGSPRVRFSSWAGKRAKFSSWGGKRADHNGLFNTINEPFDYEPPEEKRAKFSSWAGKRTEDVRMNSVGTRPANLDNFDQIEQKRAKFSSWAGKRDEGKRKFSSWAGKRFDNTLDMKDIMAEDKRVAKFSSWGGKRAKFNSWGGKRFVAGDNDENGEFDENIVEEKRNVLFPWKNVDDNGKRAKFSSWGGKRGDEDWLKRARFNSWGGKRNNYNMNNTSDLLLLDHDDDDTMNKRSAVAAYTPLSWKRKPIFSSWGGKRTARSTQPQRRLIFPSNLFREHSTWGALLRPIRRGPDFYAWGGKRST